MVVVSTAIIALLTLLGKALMDALKAFWDACSWRELVAIVFGLIGCFGGIYAAIYTWRFARVLRESSFSGGVICLDELTPTDECTLNGLDQERQLCDSKLRHYLSVHPKQLGGDCGESHVTYHLPKGFRYLCGVAAIADILEPNTVRAFKTETPLTFEIFGDNKSLWTSRPLEHATETQPFQVKIYRCVTLRLVVHCPGSIGSAWAIWVCPILCR